MDRFVFKPRRHYAWAKASLILIIFGAFVWGISQSLKVNEKAVREISTTQKQEEQPDWKPVPGRVYPM